jgi:protein-S-isoprenylcysteine O-methyltransferase Ste14
VAGLRALLWPVVCMVWSLLIVAQIVLSFLLHTSGIEEVRYVGWAVLAASGVFGWLPIWELRRRGKVPKGKSYIHTTLLVESGIYGIVRHPQYLAGMLLSAALILVTQHWLIVAIGVPVMVFGYADMAKADQDLIEKFGDDYRRYMARVPRANALTGLVRALRGRGER